MLRLTMDGAGTGASGRGRLACLPPLLRVTAAWGSDRNPPSSAPLEVAVENSRVDDGCMRNRGSVAAGTHDVMVIAEGDRHACAS